MMNLLRSVRFEVEFGLAEGFSVTGFVVLACIKIMNAFAFSLLTIDIDVFLCSGCFAEEGGIAFVVGHVEAFEDAVCAACVVVYA
jgi:hypothetical protein